MIWLYIGFAAVAICVLFGLWLGYADPVMDSTKDDGSYTIWERMRSGVAFGVMLGIIGAVAGFVIGLVGSIVSGAVIEDEKTEFSRELAQTGGTWISIRPEGEYNTPHYSYFLTNYVNGEPVVENYSVSVEDNVNIFPSDTKPRIVYKQSCDNEFWEVDAACRTDAYNIYVPKGTPIPQQS